MKTQATRAILVVVVALIAIMIGCTKELGKVPPPPPPVPEACDTITYTKHIEPIIKSKCISCHGPVAPSGQVTLGSYSEVKVVSDNGKLFGVIIKGPPDYEWMPYGTSGLPQAQKELFQCWMNNGEKP